MFQIDCFRASSSYAHLKDILPEPLHPLEDLAMNLWWSWNGRSIRLMENICPELWEKEGHNPVKIIRNMEPGQLDRLAEDKTFIREMMVVYQGLNHYLTHKNTWYNRQGFGQLKGPIAYFSAEFGIHESFPIYAGGLGILAGDHLKSASDVGIPMIGVGLLYRQGYLVQRLDKDGQQHSSQTNSNFRNLPTLPVKDHRGCDLMVKIEINGRMVHARLWYSDVGRIKLLMLDTDHELNEARDRKITKQLYGGDNETRLSQEILLGMGGIKALRKLDVVPDIYHINEGHAAFLNLERLHYLIREYYYSLFVHYV